MGKKILIGAVKAALWIGFVVLAFLATADLLREGRAEWTFRYSSNLNRRAMARRLDPGNARYAKALGDFWLDEATPQMPELAAVEYRDAIDLNPYESFHWLGWARASARLNRAGDTQKGFDMAVALDPQNFKIQRDYGFYLLAQGKPQEAQKHHAQVIRLNPRMARSLTAVYLNLVKSPIALTSELLGNDPKLLRTFFMDCLTWMDEDEAVELWKVFKDRQDVLDDQCYSSYFKFLIDKANYVDARELWIRIAEKFYSLEHWDENKELFWNGDFSRPIRFPGGLEWQIAKEEATSGVRAIVRTATTGEAAFQLWIHFDGKTNIHYAGVKHLLFVEPGKTYRLTYRVDAFGLFYRDEEDRDISTDNGLYVRVRLLGGSPQIIPPGKAITGTTKWSDEQTEIRFTVPDGCYRAEVAICRDRSKNANDKIRGEASYDDFVLEVVDEANPKA